MTLTTGTENLRDLGTKIVLDVFQNLPYKNDFFFLQGEEHEFLKVLDKRHQGQKTIEFSLE